MSGGEMNVGQYLSRQVNYLVQEVEIIKNIVFKIADRLEVIDKFKFDKICSKDEFYKLEETVKNDPVYASKMVSNKT